jgi:hypothetical protein
MTQPFKKGFQFFPVSFGPYFHIPIMGIPHPPEKPQTAAFIETRVPESYPLNAAPRQGENGGKRTGRFIIQRRHRRRPGLIRFSKALIPLIRRSKFRGLVKTASVPLIPADFTSAGSWEKFLPVIIRTKDLSKPGSSLIFWARP